MLGQRCTPGTAKSTYGTGCFVLLHTGPRPVSSSHGLLTTMAYRLGADAEPQYALEVQLVCLILETQERRWKIRPIPFNIFAVICWFL